MSKSDVLGPWAFRSRSAALWAHARLLTAVVCEVVFGLRSDVEKRPRALEFLRAVDDLDELQVSRAVAIITGEMAFFGLTCLQLARRYDESYLWWGDDRLRGLDFSLIRSMCGGARRADGVNPSASAT